MRTLLSTLLFASLLGLAGSSRANDIDLVVSPKVPVGQKPTLTVKVNKDLKSATLDVKSGAGKVRQTLGPKDQGGELVFKLPHDKPGRVSWTGTLAVVFADETQGSMPLSFPTEVLSSFRFKVKDEDVDLVNHSLVVVSEHDTAKIELEVYGDEGELLSSSGTPLPNVKAGTPMKVEWNPRKAGDPLRIRVIVHDPQTAFQSMDLYPYKLEIPHEDVEFETGKHDIRPSEEPKLIAAKTEIDKGVKRFSDAIKADPGVVVRLFIRGHTDTVGSAASNRALSQRRAHAIAQWFVRRGVTVQVFAAGVGEDMPKVETPDETDEPRNRRVDYDIAIEPASVANPAFTRVK
jgi:outer membrane protein OmpA-like peptidoglycan-associated protein